jgi:hypothetical protein
MRVIGPAAFLLVLLAACGGGVSGGPASEGASSSSGGSSSGSPGSGSGDGCTVSAIDGTRACVPATAAAGQPITLSVDDPSGCLACFTTLEPCDVAVAGNTITLSLKGKYCPPAGDNACFTVCEIPSAKCTIPALAPGKYTVVVTGEGSRAGLPPRELVVSADADLTSCTLIGGGLTVPSLDGTKYARSCSVDADCRFATFGNPCQKCACPTDAISVTAGEEYEADRRASVSQCAGEKQPIACAGCPPVRARCDMKSGELTGTCKLEPGL